MCRRLAYTTTRVAKDSNRIKATTYVSWGEVSGGDGYTLYTSDGMTGRVLEGCELRSDTWICATVVEAMTSKSYATKGRWFSNAFDRWIETVGAAVECTHAMYSQDAQGMAENCFATPAE